MGDNYINYYKGVKKGNKGFGVKHPNIRFYFMTKQRWGLKL